MYPEEKKLYTLMNKDIFRYYCKKRGINLSDKLKPIKKVKSSCVILDETEEGIKEFSTNVEMYQFLANLSEEDKKRWKPELWQMSRKPEGKLSKKPTKEELIQQVKQSKVLKGKENIQKSIIEAIEKTPDEEYVEFFYFWQFWDLKYPEDNHKRKTAIKAVIKLISKWYKRSLYSKDRIEGTKRDLELEFEENNEEEYYDEYDRNEEYEIDSEPDAEMANIVFRELQEQGISLDEIRSWRSELIEELEITENIFLQRDLKILLEKLELFLEYNKIEYDKKIKVCDFCWKKFVPSKSHQITCADCRHEKKKQNDRLRKREQRQKKTKKIIS